METKPIKYLNEYHRKSSEKAQEYIKNMKLPTSIEPVLRQQERNSKDKSPDTEQSNHVMSDQEKEHPFYKIFGAKPSNRKVGQTFVTFTNKPLQPTKNSKKP